MLIELLLSVAVTALLGAMVRLELTTTPDPLFRKPLGWRATAQRADLFLSGCTVLCLIVIWLPLLFR